MGTDVLLKTLLAREGLITCIVIEVTTEDSLRPLGDIFVDLGHCVRLCHGR